MVPGSPIEVPRKKVDVKLAHLEAIEAYRKWLFEHPNAPRKKRLSMFDTFVDSAHLSRMMT